MSETNGALAEPKVTEEDINRIKAELDAERAARTRVEAEATALRKTNGETQTRLSSEVESRFRAEEEAISNAEAALNAEIESFESQAAKAFEEGNYRDGAKFNRLAAQAGNNLERQQERKTQLEQAKVEIGRRQEQAAQQPADPLASFTAPTRNWINAHPQFMQDEYFRTECGAADQAARRKGIQTDTPEYFAFVEGRLQREGLLAAPVKQTVDDDDFDDEDEEQEEVFVEPAPRKAANVAAPVSRRAAEPSGGQRRTSGTRLTLEEADTARQLFPDLPEADAMKAYSDNKAKLRAQGRLQ